MSGKSIGIETIERAVVLTNYGSFWQHYALRRVLKRFGYEPFRCESHPVVNVLREGMVPFRILRVWLLSLIGLRKRPHVLDLVRPFLQFRFVKDYHRLIGPVFERNRGADAYLAGGDSVWCGKNRHCFLLDRPSGIRRISYAPSSAWHKKYEDADWRKHMAEVVKTFNALSVREKAGAEVVKKIDSTCVVEQCIDPVFLLSAEEWRELVEKNDIRKRLTAKSVVYYSVNATTYEDLHWEFICDCAKQLGCRLSAVGIQGSNKFIPSSAWVMPSPLEFLQMIIDTDYVVTNSFHGLVFAILLHKQFAFIPQKDIGGGDPNLRQRELLDWLSLDSRWVSSFYNAGDLMTKLRELINWRGVDEKVGAEQERCLRWLKGALS